MKLNLTNAQIYTLRLLAGGTLYQLSGSGGKGRECRPSIRSRFTNDVNAPSLPVLYRLGLIDFVSQEKKDHSLFYRVRLTYSGQQAAKTMQIKG